MNYKSIARQVGIETDQTDAEYLKDEIEWEFHKYFSSEWVQGAAFYEEERIGQFRLISRVWIEEVGRFVRLIGKRWADEIVKHLSWFGTEPDKAIVAYYKEAFK